MAVPLAEEMADIIWSVGEKLLEADILEARSSSVLSRIRNSLKQQKDSKTWHIEIDRGEPIIFSQCLDDKENIIIPKIMARGVKVTDTNHEYPPFEALDISLEVDYHDNTPLVRWHIDKANRNLATGYQDGPLFHVQLGGHHHNNRQYDIPIKRPRWNYPPLDIVLFCDLVAANFFPEEWDKLKDDPTWCEKISICEKYCYEAYIEKLKNIVSISTKTVLGEFWAAKYS